MAGSLAFYNGLTPGISKMVSSIADDTAYTKGYALQANAMHDMASARKADADANKTAHEIISGDNAAVDYVLGAHGISKPEFEAYREARRNGTMPAGTNEGPGFSSGQTDRYNNALRDYAAMMTRKPHDVAQFATEMAQLPAVQRSVASAGQGGEKAASDIMLNQAALGKNVLQDRTPGTIQTANYLMNLPPEQRSQMVGVINSIHPPATQINMPGATHYGTDPVTGKPGMFQIGKDGKQIFTAIDPPPPSNPIDAEIQKRLKEKGSTSAPASAAPVQSGQAPTGLPPGAKQIGTSKGKPVYEHNGKRYIAE